MNLTSCDIKGLVHQLIAAGSPVTTEVQKIEQIKSQILDELKLARIRLQEGSVEPFNFSFILKNSVYLPAILEPLDKVFDSVEECQNYEKKEHKKRVFMLSMIDCYLKKLSSIQ